MSRSRMEHRASSTGFFTTRLSSYIFYTLLVLSTQVHAQLECTTYPCSISIAQYSLHSVPGAPGYTSPPAPTPVPPTPKPEPPTPKPEPPTPKPEPPAQKPSTTPSSSSSSSALYQPNLRPPPSSLPSIISSSNVITNSSTSATLIQSSLSSNVSSPTTTQLPLPSFSSSSILPLMTSGPSLNSTDSNGTSSSQCGQCSMAASQVQVYYWPTAPVRSDCARASAAGGSSRPSSLGYGTNGISNATQTMPGFGNFGKTDVINGFTYTFPSTYVSVVGNIAVSNSCGPLGETHANPTPVAVKAITTASYASWPTVCRPQGNYVDAVIDILDIEDIACPTWGLSDPFLTTCDGSSYLTATEGPPYNPVILVPTEFLDYDPAWGKCTQLATNGPFLMPCGVYDPPRTLSGQGAMGSFVAGPPQGGKTLEPGALSTMPALVPTPQAPHPTALPDQQAPTPHAPAAPPQDHPYSQPYQPAPKNNPSPTQNPNKQGSVTPGQDIPDQPNPGAAPIQSSQGDPSPGPGDSGGSVGSSNKQPSDLQNPPASDPQHPAPEPQPVPKTTINIGGKSSGGIGSIINSAFGSTPSSATPPNAGGHGDDGGSNPGSNPENNPGVSAGDPAQPDGAAFTPHAITALGASLSAINPSSVAIGGKTLSAGGPAFTSNGNYYSVGSAGNLIAGTLTPGSTPLPAALTFGGQTYKANSAGQIAVGGQTLTPGGAIIVSGTPISEAAGGAFAIVGGSTQSLIAPAPTQGPALLTFGGSTYTADAKSHFVVDGQTLTPGGQITVSGTALSEGPAGSGVVVVGGSSTQSLGHGGAALMTSAAVMTFGGQTITANAAGNFVVDGQTLTPGGVITVSGTPISEDTAASNVVIGSSTELLSSVAMMVTGAAVMTFNGQTYTADSHGDFTIDGQTLTPGGVITVSGMPISEAKGATDVVIGTSTEKLNTAAVQTSAMAFEGRGNTMQRLSFMEIFALTGLLVWFGAFWSW